jgi:hypothetical protein
MSLSPTIHLRCFIPIALFAVVMTGSSVFAQERVTKSHKIDEFIGEVDYEDLIARLDIFAHALKDKPNAKAHIIVYRSRRDSQAISRKYGLRATNYLVEVRGIDRSRVSTMDGGMSGCLMYELWIVPHGALPPERRFTYKYPIKDYPNNRSRH